MTYQETNGDYGRPFHSKADSPFSGRPYSVDPKYCFGKFIPLTTYTKERFVSRSQVTYFARRKWVAVTKNRNRVYVCELCSEEINDHLAA